MTKDQFVISKDAQATAEAFGDYLMEQAAQKEQFHVALSGGSTPKILFDYLATKYASADAWSKMHFYWGDERMVPPTDDDSNFKMTKERLFDKVPVPAENIHRILGESDPSQEATRYATVLAEQMQVMEGLPVFDMIILGMGGDGHTASIFPHEIALLKSENVCDVATHPESGQIRVTLSGPVINAAQEVVFLVTGAGKQEKINEIVNQSGDWKTYPASYVQPTKGKLQWYVDEAAVAGVFK